MVRNKNGKINIVLQDKQSVKAEDSSRHFVENSPFNHIDRDFSSFVGMEKLKRTIKEIYATIVINEKQIGRASCREGGYKSRAKVYEDQQKGQGRTSWR